MNILQFNEIKELKTVYVIKGDAFFANIAVEKIKKALNLTFEDMSVSYFDSENFVANDVICALEQISMFNEKRLVIVKNLSKLLTDNDKKLLEAYLMNPNLNSVGLFVDTFNNGVFEFLKNAEIIDCNVSEFYAIDFIKNRFKESNIAIDSETSKYLYNVCGGSFVRINLEVKKINDYLMACEDKQFSKEIIDLLVPIDSEIKVFDLATALSSKDISKAHKIMKQMLDNGESIGKIIGLISSHFRRLFYVKISKLSDKEIATELGVKEYAITKARQEASRLSASSLKRIMELIFDVDYMLKSGKMSSINSIYFLIFATSLV